MVDEKILEALAHVAGLAAVWREFRADLVAAAAQVEDQRRVLAEVPAPTAEPWPSIQIPPRE